MYFTVFLNKNDDDDDDDDDNDDDDDDDDDDLVCRYVQSKDVPKQCVRTSVIVAVIVVWGDTFTNAGNIY